MLVPLEVAILLLVLSATLVWDALRREGSAPKRAALVVSALGAMMIAISGRFPLPPGTTGFSPFVTAGAVIVVVGFVVAGLVTVGDVVRRRRSRGRAAERRE